MSQPHLGEPRLVYQIIVTAPGTRSQNWRGVLYNGSAQAIHVAAGATVRTGIGLFVGVANSVPFKPYGLIHSDTLARLKTSPGNVMIDTKQWGYRLSVSAEHTRSESWDGELTHAGAAVPQRRGATIQTPAGTFVCLARSNGAGLNGWFPAEWAQVRQQPVAA